MAPFDRCLHECIVPHAHSGISLAMCDVPFSNGIITLADDRLISGR
jgi:hypothetical protein